MADDTNEHVLVPGPAGELYLVPLAELGPYRLHDDEATALETEIEAARPDVSGFGDTTMATTVGNAGGRPRPQPGRVGGSSYQPIVANLRGGMTVLVPLGNLGLG